MRQGRVRSTLGRYISSLPCLIYSNASEIIYVYDLFLSVLQMIRKLRQILVIKICKLKLHCKNVRGTFFVKQFLWYKILHF